MKPSEQLAELKIILPNVASPVGSYVPAIRTGQLVMTSGQLPMQQGKLTAEGKVPDDVSLDDAAKAASVAALNALAAAADAAGGVDNISKSVRVNAFVNSSPGFTDQAKVANGASDLLVRIFQDAGRHTRAAVGVAELPLNAAVELDLIVELAN